MRRRTGIPGFGALRHHKASGLAAVTVLGVPHYLGPWRNKRAVKAAYEELKSEYLTSGYTEKIKPTAKELTTKMLLLQYQRNEERLNTSPSEWADIKLVCNAFIKVNGKILVDELGLEHFEFFLIQLIEGKLTRKKPTRGYIIEMLVRLMRVFNWAVAADRFSGEKLHKISKGLQARRKQSKFGEPSKRVEPVSDEVVSATMPFLPPVVQDMVKLHALLGCRPSELCMLRSSMVNRTGEVWYAELTEHKNAARGKRRTLHFAGKAKVIVEKYLRENDDYLFSPIASESIRLAGRKSKPRRNRGNSPGVHYTKDSYARAIVRACDKAFPPPEGLSETEVEQWRKSHRWSPNRLRHSVASKLIAAQGIEHAAAMLGHASTKTTERYTRSASEQLTEQRAIEAARLLGS